MTRRMDKELILIRMAPSISANGRMISKTDSELRNGLMDKNTKDNTKTVPTQAKAY